MERLAWKRGDSWEEEVDDPFNFEKVVTALESLLSTIELIDQEAYGYGSFLNVSTNKAPISKSKGVFSTSSPHQRFRMRIGTSSSQTLRIPLLIAEKELRTNIQRSIELRESEEALIKWGINDITRNKRFLLSKFSGRGHFFMLPPSARNLNLEADIHDWIHKCWERIAASKINIATYSRAQEDLSPVLLEIRDKVAIWNVLEDVYKEPVFFLKDFPRLVKFIQKHREEQHARGRLYPRDQKDDDKAGFHSLPTELRQMIFDFAMPEPRTIHENYTPNYHLPLLHLNRETRAYLSNSKGFICIFREPLFQEDKELFPRTLTWINPETDTVMRDLSTLQLSKLNPKYVERGNDSGIYKDDSDAKHLGSSFQT